MTTLYFRCVDSLLEETVSSLDTLLIPRVNDMVTLKDQTRFVRSVEFEYKLGFVRSVEVTIILQKEREEK
jgi:hypothetical protein